MPVDFVIGIDSSTTACKAIIWDRYGNAIAEGRSPLPLVTLHPSWYEQSANDWWEAVVQSLRQACAAIDPSRLGAICITHQRETFVPVDKNGIPLRNGIVWMDERCRPLLPVLEQALAKDNFHRTTGKPLSVNLTIGKIAWLRQYEPDVFTRTERYLDVHAYIVYCLTGIYCTGWGCADPTGLFDMLHNKWALQLAEAVGVHADQLPAAFPPGTVLGKVTPSAANKCGIPSGLPVVAGIGDGQMGGLGVNITHPGDAYLALGTSVVSGAYSENYLTHPSFRTMYGGIPDTYLLETALMGGGYTLHWFHEHIAHPGIDYEREAAELPPGSEGLLLVPYWNSVLGPYWDAAASGIVVGWRGMHTTTHLYRSILEGIALEQRLSTLGVEITTGQKVTRFIAVGGGSRSRLWCQIIADVTGKQVFRTNTTEAAALGAGILAACTVGWYSDIRQAAQAMSRYLPDPFQPDPERYELYSRIYEQVYSHLFPSLQPFIDRIPNIFDKNG
jgi:sugar (pentulose or hexulose) kinase